MTLTGFNEVYCDASYFIALFSKKDTKHRRALELFKEIKDNRITVHTCCKSALASPSCKIINPASNK